MNDNDSSPLDPLLERLRTLNALGEDAPREGDPTPGPAGATSEGADASAESLAIQAVHADVRRLGQAVAAATGLPDRHLTLGELEALVKARQADVVGAWEMPLHLSACPLCLEAFEILLHGVVLPEPGAIERFLAASQSEQAPAPIPFPQKRRMSLAWRIGIAAAVLLAAGVTWLVVQSYMGESRIDSGTLTISPGGNGSTLAKGGEIPQGTVLEASEETTAALPDGSKLTIDPQSRLVMQRSLTGDMTIDLQYGKITAAVKHQASGHSFKVVTALGNVTVVGTRFTVTSRSEPVTVYENGGGAKASQESQGKVKAVVVEVQEGKVLVKNSRSEAYVSAGQKAVMRDEPPSIEVLEK